MAGKALARLLLAAFLAVLAPLAAAAQSHLPASIARALAQAQIPESAAAFYVHEIGAARPVLAAGAERAMNPASTMKLVTTYAGLDLLGPAYSWETEVYAAGGLDKDVLTGDLVVKGGGDPKLTLENFWLLLRELRARGLREIRGDLVLDRSYFALGEFDPAQFDDQPTRPYNTGPNALLVNYKAVRLTFLPEPESRAVRILAEPPLPQLAIENRLALDGAPCGDWVARLKLDARGDGNAARFVFAGAYSSDCGARVRHYSVLGHRQYAHALFTQLWRELGGAFSGAAREGPVPPAARLLATAKSPPLSEIVRGINKFSNNVMARQLYLTLGAEAEGAPATPDKSERAIRQWLAAKGLAFPEMTIENGAGLSRVARISAAHLGQLLLAAFRDAVMPELIASLPVAAVDGTMRKRFNGAELAGQAHIKTGSLAGVRSLAGYVLDAKGRRVVVVMIVNHANAGNARAVQDELLRWVYGRNS